METSLTIAGPILTLSGDGSQTMVIGTSGQGKSVLLQAEALRLGIPYDEMLLRMEPTPEQKERERMRQKEAHQAEAKRVSAVQEAFWSMTPPGHTDFDCLHDVLVSAGLAEKPSAAQVKVLFMVLPANILGAAISWGFSDTDVREQTYEFIERNQQEVVARVRAAK
jgi:ABC-type dipeptide/oligopeptide/nickel transport system ATPase component